MGILNVTPDSFSDGGKFNTIEKAVKRAKQIESEGANIIDIGGESTGPNSQNVSLEEELKRVIPVIKRIRKFSRLPISIDTYKSEVAAQALDAGANIINDVTALRGDKNMAKIVSKYKCPIILMYSKDKTPRTTKEKVEYKDILKTIKTFLKNRIKYAEKQGVKKSQIIIDPGMGAFISGIPKYSFEIIAKLKELKELGLPILIGISRKSFLGSDSKGVANKSSPATAGHLGSEIETRDSKSATLSAIAYLNGADIIRTHNIKAQRECLKWN
ncbi:dihydropteroate synthase [Candidatus Peregrinibacteria bacterium RIFCSPLOWO2_01_FULL_39_12]|nr:MAG: dihydropteroate synthase [Candidatus Peregrinibacteria bacterium RIFCSPLOWO2_01_FULL_39_12]